MSRCFPYPPPGFEQKARSEYHWDLLAKEKQKERENKKKKRVEQKKEGNGKKDRDKSKDKHREKKERKERHRDEKRDRDKYKTSDDGRIEAQNGGHNEQKAGVVIPEAEDVRNSRFTEELGRRIEVEKHAAANRMFNNIITGSIPKRVEGLRTSTCNENPASANFVTTGQRKSDGVIRPVEKASHIHQALSPRRPMVSNFTSTEKRKVEYGIFQAMEDGNLNHQALLQTHMGKYKAKSTERKEKGKNSEADNGHADICKNREGDQKKHAGKVKIRDKERAKQEKRMKNGEIGHKEHDTPNKRGKRDQVDSLNTKPVAPHGNNRNFADNYGHIKKRKELGMNGFLHGDVLTEDEVSPNKLPRPAVSCHQQNGKTLKFDRIHSAHPTIRHGAPNNNKAEIMKNTKKHLVNDNAAGPQPYPADLRPSVAAGTSKALSKPPHPDSKFLIHIYSVPKMEVWSEYDGDQEWLFSSSNHQLKPEAEFEVAEETVQVWAKGLKIESADIFGLPYVIPY